MVLTITLFRAATCSISPAVLSLHRSTSYPNQLLGGTSQTETLGSHGGMSAFGAPTAKATNGPRLRFCPESNDLLYPREDRERRVLVFFCKSCNYQEDAQPSEWLVYRCVLISHTVLPMVVTDTHKGNQTLVANDCSLNEGCQPTL